MYQRPPLTRLLWTTLVGALLLAPACAGTEALDEPVATADSTRTWSVTDDAGGAVGPDASPTVDVSDHEDTAPVTDVGGVTDAEAADDVEATPDAEATADTEADIEGVADAVADIAAVVDVVAVTEVGEPDVEAPVEEVGGGPVCGDGVCEVVETCTSCAEDCPVCRPGAGEVIITEIMQNPQVVTDEYGEWFEVLNLTEVPLSLEGVLLRDAGADAHILGGPFVVQPGGYAVLAAEQDLGVGLSADYIWDDFYLGNASDLVALEFGGVLIDAVAYDGGTLWPDPTGASMSLDPSAQTALDNDDGAMWCTGVVTYGDGDLGTPGAANLVCGEPPPSVCGDATCADDETCTDCEVDCGVCPCPEGQVYDCLGGCFDTGAVGDGACDPELDCPEHGFDGGDCLGPGCGALLFFSEYVEGSSNHKALEIYNPTGLAVDLSDYAIWKITNGGLWTDEDLDVTPLLGTLEPGDVYVACHTGLDAALPGVCDAVTGGNPTNFNGDDALGLAHQGILIDVIGTEGEDPGTGWEMAGTAHATKDHTLVRDPAVTAGVADWAGATATWLVLDTDNFEGLGSHDVTVTCPTGETAN